MLRRTGLMAIVLVLCTLQTGCATLLNDDHQMVAFSSEPDGATIKVDGVAMGKTPSVVPVPRKGGDKIVSFELSDHKTLMVELDNKIAAAGFGNIIFGGFIGAGVDAITGRAGSYQKSLHVVLERGSGTVSVDSQSLKDAKDLAREEFETAESESNSAGQSQGTKSDNWLLEEAD